MIRKITLFIVVACLVLVTLLSGCYAAAGPVSTREYNISDFKGIETSSQFEVEIVPSDNYSVSITTSDDLFQNVIVSKSGKTLKLGLNGINTWFIPVTLKARVGMPEIQELKISGASKVTARGFKSIGGITLGVSGASILDMDMEIGKFVADISGASKVGGRLKASVATVNVSGAGRIELAGTSGNTSVNASGAAQVLLWDLTADNVDVDLSGGSRASIYTHGKLNADISGGSTLEYSGGPTFDKVNVTGGAALKPR